MPAIDAIGSQDDSCPSDTDHVSWRSAGPSYNVRKKGRYVMLSSQVRSLANFAWGVADLLRGDFKQFEYGKIILPFVVLRRLDCLLESTKDAVVARSTLTAPRHA